MRFAFVIDPIEHFNIDADTSFAFMLAAQERGHEIYAVDPDDLAAELDEAWATVRPCEVRRERGNHYTLGDPSYEALHEMDVVMMRKDPPFDVPYLHACHLLELAEHEGALVANRPGALRAANEKLFALQFAEATPHTVVTRSHERIKSFLAEEGGRCIIKPIDGHGGEGILVLDDSDRNLNALLELATRQETDYLICQRYLPEAREGDKRILMLDGEPMGAILRVPPAGEHRGNIHVGGAVEPTELSARDREICEQVGPTLSQMGLWFVGLDVIGEHLTEINVTSPTGIQEMSRFDEVDGAGQVVDWLARRAEEQRPG